MKDQLVRYLTFGRRTVGGWLGFEVAAFIAALGDIQRSAGYRGAVGEIGVHHGRLFILLLLLLDKDEGNFAIDVFEQQHLNTDRSGRGDREVFLSNVQRWSGREASIIARSSLEVRQEDILSLCGRVRLASIDGGHTRECALNDLRLIEGVLTDQGIAIVDDYFNSNWPDVSAAVAEYLFDKTSKLVPFAVNPNKVYLTARTNSAFYRAELRKRFTPIKGSKMFGYEVDIYEPAPTNPGLIEHFKLTLKESPIGPYLLVAKSALLRNG
jgi:hypothetical protein